MEQAEQPQWIYSKPTQCPQCRLVVEMVHELDTDPVNGSWQCPKCGHGIRFSHRTIEVAGKPTIPRTERSYRNGTMDVI
ncbi:MAG: hypothetical protein A2751_00705 [Candidatus Doudnabacteria bacterium RIFCSPHIGHO2_01_FULL_46_14]|uniref:Uncharacterized protein n=1 Tax=Candidatus Doudnabacteria bacterium RIFCSPHIGHO2_01_FULL_46_14 TaxID=1817824 RepID=A0A1F5NNL9_9BACT|nr:MAG: hypothetical protein A2751_00705 [Candidatus Doudnabacteria bacterium RIFCSPHIGHO2_01_FULL_46_14]